MITSVHNEKVKNWLKLQDKKYRDATQTFLIESEHLVKEALKKKIVKELIVLEGYEYPRDISATYVTKEVMKKISSQVTPPKICAVCQMLEEKEVKGHVLVLDDLQDPGNVGTIIRSAVAFGIPNIVLSKESVDIYNPKVIRSCEGMIFYVNITRKNIFDFLASHQNDYLICGTDVKKGKLLEDTDLKGKDVCLIIGNEGRGMNESYQKYCETLFKIPMDERCESLNAGVSASILMYELTKK